MVNYDCARCGYSTTHKSVFKKHLIRKNLCNPISKEIDRYSLLTMNNFDKLAKQYTSVNKCNTYVVLPVDPNTPKCDHCGKEFKSRQGKYKHMKFYCKKKKEDMDKDVIIKELKERNNELKNMIEKLINSKTNINKCTINNANGDINTMNNIQITNYGSENIDYITDKVFKKLLTKPLSAITRLIELKHFHPNHPENHNVKITNIHDKYAKIYQDKKWLIKHKKDVVEDLVENGYADFEEFKDLSEDEIAEKIKEKYLLMQKNYHDNFEKICKKSELSIINETISVDI
jgi:hypothetical protein|uniref:C2H2-type domain-containing protein n=1 Tax=viral metagenome TaxID=1070528 RepID=A0A6C0IU27_9ZZZZ